MLSLTFWQWTWISASVLGAGIVRGIAGFGFSLITAVLLMFVFPPAQIVPVILLWEIAASIGHLPFIYRQVDWRSLGWLSVGMLIGTPLGVWALSLVAPGPMCAIINGTVVVLALMMLRGTTLRHAPGRCGIAGIGLLGGAINGASANGGPPVILFFLSSPAGAAVGRASLIAYFLLTDTWASLICWQQGLFSLSSFLLAASMLVPLGLGVALGSRVFRHIEEARFKIMVLLLLLLVAVTGIVKSLF